LAGLVGTANGDLVMVVQGSLIGGGTFSGQDSLSVTSPSDDGRGAAGAAAPDANPTPVPAPDLATMPTPGPTSTDAPSPTDTPTPAATGRRQLPLTPPLRLAVDDGPVPPAGKSPVSRRAYAALR
jgi:hypothetical protein